MSKTPARRGLSQGVLPTNDFESHHAGIATVPSAQNVSRVEFWLLDTEYFLCGKGCGKAENPATNLNQAAILAVRAYLGACKNILRLHQSSALTFPLSHLRSLTSMA